MREQLRDLVAVFQATSVHVVDVGGDILAQGDEQTLRSPLADALVTAACYDLGVPVDVSVAGAGLDAELPEDYVVQHAGELVMRLLPEHVEQFARHPRMAPLGSHGVVAAAALGARRVVEIRDRGLPVAMTDHSPEVFRIDHATVASRSRLVPERRDTRSLDKAEAVARRVCGFSEIDYEREKAAHMETWRQVAVLRPREIARSVHDFSAEAMARGADYVTFRRLAEALRMPPDFLRPYLAKEQPERCAHGLRWSLRPVPAAAR